MKTSGAGRPVDRAGPGRPGSPLSGAALMALVAITCGACAFSPFPTASAASSPDGSSARVAATGTVPPRATGDDVVLVRQREESIRATFIVKFSDEPETIAIARSWRRDPDGASARYTSWAADHPELRHLVLKSASYSGELVLALPASAPRHIGADDVLATLRGMDNIAYADIDSIAHPSSGGTP